MFFNIINNIFSFNDYFKKIFIYFLPEPLQRHEAPEICDVLNLSSVNPEQFRPFGHLLLRQQLMSLLHGGERQVQEELESPGQSVILPWRLYRSSSA